MAQKIIQPSQASQKLKFRIVYCDGEDPEYSASELLTQSPQSKGWQSPRFCDYPIEMILHFMTPVRVKQIQFLSHQSKIASKIDIFVFFPDKNVQTDLVNDLKFKKLGYLSLDTNERSNFQARELKSVYLDNPAQYMKLVFQKCHVNKYNLFNQVGLIALSVFGEELVNKQDKTSQNAMNRGFENLEFESQFDAVTLDRLRLLGQAKQKAINEEDFVEAKRLKDMTERLMKVGTQLSYLEERKMVAVEKEDFDAAQIIKAEIDKLRNTIAPENILGKHYAHNDDNDDINQNQNQNKQPSIFPSNNRVNLQQFQPQNNRNQMIDLEQDYNQQQAAQQPSSAFRKPQQQHQESFEPPSMQQHDYPIHKNDYNATDEGNEPEQRGDYNEAYINEKPIQPKKISKHSEDAIIPAVLHKNQVRDSDNNPFGIEDKQGQSTTQAEPITGANSAIVADLIPVYGEEICAKLVSKNWQLREEALKWIQSQVRNPRQLKVQDQGVQFMAYINTAAITIEDKINQVVSSSLQLLLDALHGMGKVQISQSTQELVAHLESILESLMERIGDNNGKIQQMACEAFVEMAGCTHVTVQRAVQFLTKSEVKGKLSSHKHLHSRLTVLSSLIKIHRIDNGSIALSPVMEFANRMLDHSSNEVRHAAIMVCVEAARFVGEARVKEYLTNIKTAQLEVFEKELLQQGASSPRSQTKQNQQQQQQSSTSQAKQSSSNANAKKGPNKAGSSMPQQDDQNQNQPQQNSKQCEFCGLVNNNFSDPGKFDVHLWKDCAMLCTCVHCAQVIEIAELNEHLLQECQFKSMARKCPRCKEAVRLNDFDVHTQSMQCKPFQPPNIANRCPLCHSDIPPRKAGWKRHLVTDGCPNNERTTS